MSYNTLLLSRKDVVHKGEVSDVRPRLLYRSPIIVGFTVNVPKKVEAFGIPVGGISESWGNTQAKTLPLL